MSNEAHLETAAAGEPGSLAPLALLFAPDRAMERQAKVGRARWYFLFAWLCSLLLAGALAYRVDARSSTLRKLEASGQLKEMSDRQIADETRNAERVAMVATLAKGAVGVPVQLGLTSASILVLCWFFRGRVKGSAVVPVAAATLMPAAIADLLDAATAYHHAVLPPEGVPLAPRSLSAVMPLVGRPLVDPWLKLGHALDFYSLWGAVMLGYGVAAVGQVPRRTAIIGTVIAWICYRLLTKVAIGG
ncbi:MAG: YIP1 family protein [Polyangiaceae bacterium]|nr:YIP1 family protein [Polyangiaceae bacterium]